MSSDLAKKLELAREELAVVREQLTPLISVRNAGIIETAAACAEIRAII